MADYTPIRVSSLRGDLKIPFDVYVQVAGKYIHYCRRGDSFEGARLDRLKAKKLQKMYIRQSDEIPYRQYLEQSVDEAYGHRDKPIEVRAEVIQGFQQSAAEEFIDDPKNEDSYRHLHSSLQRFVGFLRDETHAARALLGIKNLDLSITHHGVNVATLATAIALQSTYRDDSLLHLLALGCLLHDIDHIYSSVDIARPLSEFTTDEVGLYRNHPLSGAHRLQGAAFIDPLVMNVVTQHEENAKGTGFPKKLTENEMDPLVMIAATANAYDRRVTFEGKPPKDALKELLIDLLGNYPLPILQVLQKVLKDKGVVT